MAQSGSHQLQVIAYAAWHRILGKAIGIFNFDSDAASSLLNDITALDERRGCVNFSHKTSYCATREEWPRNVFTSLDLLN